MSHPLASACPDLIVLYPGSGHLTVLAYRIGLRLKAPLWRERVTWSADIDLVAELPPLLARHPLRLETPTALVADPASGGFLLVPGQGNAQRNLAWVERQLELALPYPPQELHWRTRTGSARVELFWLPKTWIKSQADALLRLGLCLKEIYPRASLWREEAGKSPAQQPCLLLEADALHVFDDGLVQRSVALPAEAEAASHAQQLERLALGTNAAGAVRRPPAESGEALAQRVLALWLDGSDAIHLSVGRWASWQPALKLSAACATVVAIAAIGLSSLNAAMESTLDGLTRDQRKLAPIEQKFTQLERSMRSDRKYAEAARALDGSLLPLATLNRVSAALPDKYWIQHLQFKGETLDLTGRGGGNDDVIRLLGKSGIEATAITAENVPTPADKPGKDGFNIRLQVKKQPGGGAR